MRKWLKDLRSEKGLSQQEIADKLKIASNYYSMIENGKRKPKLTIDIVEKLVEIFDVSVEFIMNCERKDV